MNEAFLYLRKNVMWVLFASLIAGAVATFFAARGTFVMGWLAASFLLLIGLTLMVFFWRWAGGGKTLFWVMMLAAVLRLGVGVATSRLVPVYGYDQLPQNSGYIFYDAYSRDNQAWDLAISDKSLSSAFSQEFVTDQYGGLLSISAWIYRYLSPDAHRPYLIVILTAVISALGAAFFWQAVRIRWGEAVARPAVWILALYPAGIWLGSSQMREAFLIAFSAIAFWGVIVWPTRRWSGILGFVSGLVGLVIFSSRIALPIFIVLVIWAWLEQFGRTHEKKWPAWVWVVSLGIGLALVLVTWSWFQSSMGWDVSMAIKNSGMLQTLVRRLGKAWALPVVMGYGVTQPVLPAAVVDVPSAIFWYIPNILLSLGWYLLAPLLIYGFFTVWTVKKPNDRRLLILTSVVVILWSLISAARAGGDQIDNPRYRTVFLIWLAFLAGWAWQRARSERDPWLVRWLAVEGIFLAFFIQWYGSRYYPQVWGTHMDFILMVLLIIGSSGVVLVGGWIWDRRKKKSSPHTLPE